MKNIEENERLLIVGEESGEVRGVYHSRSRKIAKLYISIYFKFFLENEILLTKPLMALLMKMNNKNIIHFGYGDKKRIADKYHISAASLKMLIKRMTLQYTFIQIGENTIMVSPYFAAKTEKFTAFGMRKKWNELLRNAVAKNNKHTKQRKIEREAGKRLRIVRFKSAEINN